MKKLIKTIILALVCLMIIIFTFDFVSDVFGGSGVEVNLSVPDGATGGQVVELLADGGVIEHPTLFKIFATLTGNNTKYRSGEFTVNSGDSYNKILKIMTGNPNSGKNTVKITIPEGFEVERIADAFDKAGVTPREEFLAAASTDEYDFEFLKDIKNKSQRKYVLEGYLFPDTYTFGKNTPAKTVVETMLKEFEQVMSKYPTDNIDQTVILASIIEREALGDSDRHKVSSVFHNRLNRSDYLSRLQSCATVQYILGERKAVLSEADTQIESPYNTYIHPGLPAGPIANPGEAAIEAALNPAETEYLYFGLNKNGEHAFSKTYEEHLRLTR